MPSPRPLARYCPILSARPSQRCPPGVNRVGREKGEGFRHGPAQEEGDCRFSVWRMFVVRVAYAVAAPHACPLPAHMGEEGARCTASYVPSPCVGGLGGAGGGTDAVYLVLFFFHFKVQWSTLLPSASFVTTIPLDGQEEAKKYTQLPSPRLRGIAGQRKFRSPVVRPWYYTVTIRKI